MKDKSVGIIIENSKNQILLFLRDDKPTIPYPNHWSILGGQVEEGESTEEAIRREIKEEIELDLTNFSLFKVFNWPEQTEYVYYAKMNLDISKINLHEGQKLQFFNKSDIEKMKLAFHDNETLKEFFLGVVTDFKV